MDRLGRKLVLVTRRTRLDELVARFNTVAQAKFYVEHLGADFGDYEREHKTYAEAVRRSEQILSRHARVQVLDRAFLPNFVFPPDAPVVVLGQDGLVANTLKYLDGQAVIGVNPDPERWDGRLLPYTVGDLEGLAPEVLASRCTTRTVSMGRVRLSDGQELHAVNDFFIGAKSHVSARYAIQFGEQRERHSSSGIIVSTGLGSSGWLRSVLTSVLAIGGTGGRREIAALRDDGFAWDADHLYFSVREPFPSRMSQTGLVFGKVTGMQPLRVVSEMADGGVIFSDGIEADYLTFSSGMEAVVDVAQRRGVLVS